jgi:hypothetical protein
MIQNNGQARHDEPSRPGRGVKAALAGFVVTLQVILTAAVLAWLRAGRREPLDCSAREHRQPGYLN